VAGKDKVLVRHLLAHTAGLLDWDGPVGDLYDWPSATARLAALAPQWEPGSAAGYHSLTQGFLIGEVVRRITGQSLAASSPGRWPGRWGPTSTSGCPPGMITGWR
jgi:CubicO group peptidase (beta-lactamase class C family)